MSEHVGFVVKVTQLRDHSNADRMRVATFFGNDTCVDLSVKEGDMGIYFPSDLQLSPEYCEVNNLVRKKDDAGNNIGGYLDPDKRNIRPIKLRGEISDGLYMPIQSIGYCGIPLEDFNVGDTIETVGGHEICRKYIPRTNKVNSKTNNDNKRKKVKIDIAPLFALHADTEQLAYNLNAFKPGDQIEITLKMHGTSQRTGCLPTIVGYHHRNPIYNYLLKKDPNTLGNTAFKWYEHAIKTATPIWDWKYVSGTRRTTLTNYEGGYYGSNAFREPHSKIFEGKLHKGEEVFYEVVGFTTDGSPIMPNAQNQKTNDKEFIKTYGEVTQFSYGCSPTGTKTIYYSDDVSPYSITEDVPQSDIYVYRMTMTNEDGDVVEYTPDFMRYRCEQMGVKCVPVLWQDYINGNDLKGEQTAGEYIKEIAEAFYDGPDPIGKTHIREGVVVRIVNKPKFTAFKHKNFWFKCIEGLIKDSSDAPDIEEAEDINEV